MEEIPGGNGFDHPGDRVRIPSQTRQSVEGGNTLKSEEHDKGREFWNSKYSTGTNVGLRGITAGTVGVE
eukprot:1820411-Pyramimonas_sp.AAC.1